MISRMVGDMFPDIGKGCQPAEQLVHFRITRQGCKAPDIRIPVKNSQCLAFEQDMQRQPDFNLRLDGLEVKPPFTVYLYEIIRCQLAEVGESQSGIAAEQEGILYMAH